MTHLIYIFSISSDIRFVGVGLCCVYDFDVDTIYACFKECSQNIMYIFMYLDKMHLGYKHEKVHNTAQIYLVSKRKILYTSYSGI